ncbi:DUF308 domain-containing protein [Lactococcus sp. DD01]|uniref:DUF308 domain-containing protein n=1 Tax=Lactococcus sp. DD01 TaxID=1776443 RepID=UPI00077613A9|nr:DUF308 domain-containing protein [Lactococcus sp. DD01]KXT59417.1 hypothetical protein LACDD01_02072 [Lactococcus sp. DD01]
MNEEFSQKLKNGIGINGVISLLIGGLILFLPDKVAQIGTIIIGIAFLIIGLFYLIPALKSSNTEGHPRFSHILLGAIYTIVGICSLINLAIATNIIFIVIGILVGLTWIVEGIISFVLRHYLDSNKGFLTSGGGSIIAGLIFLFVPFWGTMFLWTMLGVISIILGIIKIIQYLTWGK